MTLASCHKRELKKSNMVKIEESEQQYDIYLFKVETFLSKRHQVNMFLSTFHGHVLFLESSDFVDFNSKI